MIYALPIRPACTNWPIRLYTGSTGLILVFNSPPYIPYSFQADGFRSVVVTPFTR